MTRPGVVELPEESQFALAVTEQALPTGAVFRVGEIDRVLDNSSIEVTLNDGSDEVHPVPIMSVLSNPRQGDSVIMLDYANQLVAFGRLASTLSEDSITSMGTVNNFNEVRIQEEPPGDDGSLIWIDPETEDAWYREGPGATWTTWPGGSGGGTDEVWIGPNEPPSPDAEWWVDTDDSGGVGTGGADEVWIGSEEPTDPGLEIWIDPDAPDEVLAPLLPKRQYTSFTTGSLANNATGTGLVTYAAGFVLYMVRTSAAARVRFYPDTTKRDADLSRPVGTDPVGRHGLLLELVTDSSADWPLSPLVTCWASSPTYPITAWSVTNVSGASAAITVDVLWLPLEATEGGE